MDQGEAGSTVAPQDPVGKLINRTPVTVHPDDTLEQVSALLVSESIGAVLVQGSNGEIVGLVSERDVVRNVGDPDLEADRASDIMTFEVEAVDESTTVSEVGALMRDGQVRHFPVRNATEIVGVVSIRDVLSVLLG